MKILPAQEIPTLPATIDASKTPHAVWAPIIISALVALGSASGWIYERRSKTEELAVAKIQEEQREELRLLQEYLVPIELALQTTKGIYQDLRDESLEPGWGVLESYVIKASREGVEKHALLNKRINRMVANNAKIISLLEGYAPYVLTDEFKQEAAEFREHAQNYIDRWDIVPTTIQRKEQLPVAKVFPQQFPTAVREEIIARKAKLASLGKPA